MFMQVCTPNAPFVSKAACHNHKKKWRVNAKLLMSGHGIPHGMRIGLSFRAFFTKNVPGIVEVRFLYDQLGVDESFQILVDGYVQYSVDGYDEK